jgi:hypothetical protein
LGLGYDQNGYVPCFPTEREIPIPSRQVLLFALIVLAVGPSPWSRRDLAGQEERGRSTDTGLPSLVQGTVVSHETGDPLRGAAVSLRPGPSGNRGRGTRITGETGRFIFRDVPEGTYLLSVTVPSFRTMRDTVQVEAQVDLELRLPLSAQPIPLEPIVVIAERRRPPPRRDYERRLQSRSGFLVTREDIERRDPRLITEMLNPVPGAIVLSTPPYGYSIFLRGQCRPGIWVDGFKVPWVDSIDQLISPMDVEAIEVYHGWELPVEFGVDSCGGVLIWTRQGESPPPGSGSGSGRGFIRGLIGAVGVVLAIFFLT